MSTHVGHLRSLLAARDLLDRDYARPLDLAAVAAAAGYSRYHFLRAFRAAYGDTPGRYLTRRRVERAKELLAGDRLTVTEICHRVGFSSVGSFSARFSELVGMSPTAYRAARRGHPAVPGCFVFMFSNRGEATAGESPDLSNPGEASGGRHTLASDA